MQLRFRSFKSFKFKKSKLDHCNTRERDGGGNLVHILNLSLYPLLYKLKIELFTRIHLAYF